MLYQDKVFGLNSSYKVTCQGRGSYNLVFLDVRITATGWKAEAVAGKVEAVPLRQIMTPAKAF